MPRDQVSRDLSGPDESRFSRLVTITDSPYDACAGAHAIAVLTDWQEFKSLDFKRIYDKMQVNPVNSSNDGKRDIRYTLRIMIQRQELKAQI